MNSAIPLTEPVSGLAGFAGSRTGVKKEIPITELCDAGGIKRDQLRFLLGPNAAAGLSFACRGKPNSYQFQSAMLDMQAWAA